MSSCVPHWVYPAWDSLCFLDLVDYFLSHVRDIFSYYFFKFSLSLLFLGLLQYECWYILCGPRGLLDCLQFFFILFSIFYFAAVISTILSSRSLVCCAASVILLLIPSSILFISICFLVPLRTKKVSLGLW